MHRVVHFVGFRGEEFWSAVKLWGYPHMVHMGWDKRAKREIGEDDLVIVANGADENGFSKYNYPDMKEGI